MWDLKRVIMSSESIWQGSHVELEKAEHELVLGVQIFVLACGHCLLNFEPPCDWEDFDSNQPRAGHMRLRACAPASGHRDFQEGVIRWSCNVEIPTYHAGFSSLAQLTTCHEPNAES